MTSSVRRSTTSFTITGLSSQGGQQRWPDTPVVVCGLYYLCLVPISISVHDKLLQYWNIPPVTAQNLQQDQSHRIPVVAYTLEMYWLWLLVWRLYIFHQQVWVWYEYCWFCNFTLLLSSIAIATHRPYLALMYCVVVSIDQVLWYVDLLYYFTTRIVLRISPLLVWPFTFKPQAKQPPPRSSSRFLIGVCQYVFDDQTSWQSRITCTHHLWTIPVVLCCIQTDLRLCHLESKDVGLWSLWRLLSLLAFVTMTLHVVVSRMFIPLYYRPNEVETTSLTTASTKYLNVNLGHAVWKDVTLSWIQITHPSPAVYLPKLLWRWQFLNMIFALIWLRILLL